MQSCKSIKVNEKELAAFKTIVEFVTNLYEHLSQYGVKNKPLSLYYRLVTNSRIHDDDIILQHIRCFKSFCVANRVPIRERQNTFETNKIVFSDNIYIDMNMVFSKADTETQSVIQEYLLTISAYVDPENKTKDVLQALKSEPSNENQFLSNMIETLGSQIDPSKTKNPLALLTDMMSSNVVGSMMENMNNDIDSGKLNIDKLMSSMMGIMNTMKSEVEKSDDPNLKQLLNMMNLPDSA